MTPHLPDLPPWATTLAATVVAWHLPTPPLIWRTVAAALKGIPMSLNADQIKEAIHDAQKLVKLALEFVPGTTPDEKASYLTTEVKPMFDQAIANLGLPAFANDFAGKIFGWMILAEVKAAEAA